MMNATEFNPLKHIIYLMTHDEMQVLNYAVRPTGWTIKSRMAEDGHTPVILDNYQLLQSALKKLSDSYLTAYVESKAKDVVYCVENILQPPPEEGMAPVQRARQGDRLKVVAVVGDQYMVVPEATMTNEQNKGEPVHAWPVQRSLVCPKHQHLLLHTMRTIYGLDVTINPTTLGLDFSRYHEKLQSLLQASTTVVGETA